MECDEFLMHIDLVSNRWTTVRLWLTHQEGTFSQATQCFVRQNKC